MRSRVNLICDSHYEQINRSPLNKMMTAANNVKDVSNYFGDHFKWRLLVLNAEVSEINCFSKIHKPGDKMRPIVTIYFASCTNFTRWWLTYNK